VVVNGQLAFTADATEQVQRAGRVLSRQSM
jgi:hypothetical protein